MTIVEAIIKALTDLDEPSTYEQIYKKIIDEKYFEFEAQEPLAVVRVQLRRYCANVTIKSATNTKKFFLSKGGRGKEELFVMLDKPIDILLPLSDGQRGGMVSNENQTTSAAWFSKLNEPILIGRSETHGMAMIECGWMMLGAFLPIITDSLVRVLLLGLTFSEAFIANIRGGEVFLLTSALISPFYFMLYKYVKSDNESKRENHLPYFGIILLFTIVSTLASLFAFSYYRIGLVLKDQYPTNPIAPLFDFEFGVWAWGIYAISLLIWYYSSYINHSESGEFREIRRAQQELLGKDFARTRGES